MSRTIMAIAAICLFGSCSAGHSDSTAASPEPTGATQAGPYGIRCGDRGPTMYRAADIGKIDVHYVNAQQRALVRHFQPTFGPAHLWFTFVDVPGEKAERFLLFNTGSPGDPCTSGVGLLDGRPHENFSPKADYPYLFIGPE